MPNPCEPLEPRTLCSTSSLRRPDHVVIVVEENHSYADILGPAQAPTVLSGMFSVRRAAPFLRSVAHYGANLVNMSAETHPSQPNYLALFSGSTWGVTDDATPDTTFPGPSLGGEPTAAGLTFAGYSESLPHAGFNGSEADGGLYARKHNPWVNFSDVPASANLPFSAFPRRGHYDELPTVSIVVPNQENDMHSGPVRTADRWLRDHLRPYLRWAKKHNSLLVVTWDEGRGDDNHIPTLLAGAGVRRGKSNQPLNHYNLLRTIEEMYDLGHAGAAAQAAPITGVWK